MRVLLAMALPLFGQHVVFVAGDDEYRSEYSLPAIARVLEAHHGMRTSVALAKPTPQTNTHIEGLEALKAADLAVMFLRWRQLPPAELQRILDYVEAGKPVVGLRTSTHTFKYPPGDANEKLNDGFPLAVYGAKWTRHHGHLSTTDVSIARGQEQHPVLRGVAAMHVPSWLYTVTPLQGDCVPLLMGRAVNPQGVDASPQPVAWVKTHKGGRVFFTTLGHPGDFREESMRRLAVNGILWALGREVPPNGARVDVPGGYNPPPSGVPAAR